MSPAPAKTSYPVILNTARHLIETQGLENLSMKLLANTLGIRAPSLYKHIDNRAQLVRTVLEALLVELGELLAGVAKGHSLDDDIREIVMTYRDFAHEHPTLYSLLYSRLSAEMQPDVALLEIAVAPLLNLINQRVGEAQSLSATRLIVSFTHGFVDMELSGSFRLGGDLDEAFKLGLDSLIKVLHGLGPTQE